MSIVTELFAVSSPSRLPSAQIVLQKCRVQTPPPHEFVAVLCPDVEEGGFSVFALNYPGVISQGETLEEAQANIAEAFMAVLESRRKHGEQMEYSSRSVVDHTPDCLHIRVTIDG